MKKQLNFSTPPNFPELEEEILAFWEKDGTFEKSVQQRPADKAFVFYDGPPFATGLPHYGHILASTIKDVIPRYWTMKGYRVERVWGWDCHGLPIENMIEGELQLKGGKKGIEEYGIAKFNDACRTAILRFDKEWEKIIKRIGRWVDFEHSYKTMDTTYMESVWWGFSELNKKNLIYQGRKVVLYCPRCATPLSNFEIAMDNSYKDVADNSVYIKFQRVDQPNEYFLAWTTTPWTLPGNVAVAVLEEADYVKAEVNGELLWLAESRVEKLEKLTEQKFKIIEKKKGKELVGLEYKPLYDVLSADAPKAYYVVAADFVSLEDGTGIVHTAAIYGEDDYALAQKMNLPCIPTLDDQGKFLPSVPLVEGLFYKKAEAPIMEDLKERNLLFFAESYTHSYPFCYRCGTPLYYSAVPAWFIDVQKMKKDLLKNNEATNWFPEHLKHGRFGKGLETAPDWNISRSRYWGTPMPVWTAKAEHGLQTEFRVVSSIEELKKWAVEPEKVANITDIHREFLDDIEVWVDDAKTVKGKRINEVFDCWVESGSMPYAAVHYPFEHKEWFDRNYPAQFISEYIAQTRAWFYCMHVISSGLFNAPAFQNALTTGTILAEDGTKMSKSKKNYPDPTLLINEYGVDSLRLYLMSSVVMKADNVSFSEKEVSELRKKVFVIWWNVFSFYQQFTQAETQKPGELKLEPTNIMDQWIISRLATVTENVTKSFDQYDVVKGTRTLIEFVNEVSTWYLRQSRERLKSEKGQKDAASSQVLGYVLLTLTQLFAPVTPFFSELLFHQLVNENDSVHLSDWPTLPKEFRNEVLEQEMLIVQKIVEQGHAQRRDQNIKVRQPLAGIKVSAPKLTYQAELEKVLEAELNIKHVTWKEFRYAVEPEVTLETTLTPELEAEGKAREIMRQIQALRKAAGANVDDWVSVELPEWPAEWEEQIKAKTKVKSLGKGEVAKIV